MTTKSERLNVAINNILAYLKNQTTEIKSITTKSATPISGIPYKQCSALLSRMADKSIILRVSSGSFILNENLTQSVSVKKQPVKIHKVEDLKNKKLVGFELIQKYPGCKFELGHIVKTNISDSEKLLDYKANWKPIYEEIKEGSVNDKKIKEAIEFINEGIAILNNLLTNK